MKTCSKCKEHKGLDEFTKASRTKDGKYPYCKVCKGSYDKKWHSKNPGAKREFDLKNKYSITLYQYDEMEAAQGGTCAICNQEETSQFRGKVKRLAVDHCHENGHVRALLCKKCNVSLGNFNDDPERFRAAAYYLEAHAPDAPSDQPAPTKETTEWINS